MLLWMNHFVGVWRVQMVQDMSSLVVLKGRSFAAIIGHLGNCGLYNHIGDIVRIVVVVTEYHTTTSGRYSCLLERPSIFPPPASVASSVTSPTAASPAPSASLSLHLCHLPLRPLKATLPTSAVNPSPPPPNPPALLPFSPPSPPLMTP